MNATFEYEPYRFPAGVLAFVVHTVFFSLLFFGFNWNRQTFSPPTMSVELWSDIPEKTVAPPVKQVVEESVARPQESKATPDIVIPEKKKTVTKPVEEPQEKKKKDMTKQKLAIEKERLIKKQKARELAEKLRREDRLALEKAELLKKEQQAARDQAAKAKQEELAAAQGKIIDEYGAKIKARIRRYIHEPPDLSPDAQAEFSVTVLPGGSVLPPKLTKSSGNMAYDEAVERAILKSQPLPVPPDIQLFNRFRNLNLLFKPEKKE